MDAALNSVLHHKHVFQDIKPLQRNREDAEKMPRKSLTISQLDELLKPVKDLEKRIRDQFLNGYAQSGCSGPRVAVQSLTAFRDTPRGSLHPPDERLGKVEQRLVPSPREFSPSSSLSSDGSSRTPRDSCTPEELRAFLLINTPSPPPPFAPCPPSSSPRHRRTQIPVRLLDPREKDKEVAGGVRLATAQHVFRAWDQICRRIMDPSVPQIPAACRRLLPSLAPPPPRTPSLLRIPAPEKRQTRRVVRHPPEADLSALVAPPQAPGGVRAPPQTPAPPPPRGAVGGGAPDSPQTPAPGKRKTRRVVRHPPEADFSALVQKCLQSVDRTLEEELQPVSNPSETLCLSLRLLTQNDCKNKIEGLRYIRTLAQHHREELESCLRMVCIGVTQEITNRHPCVSCAALDTVVYLCIYLQKSMDKEAEWTCESLLQVFPQANTSVVIQEHTKAALAALVHSCSPSRFLNSLVNKGLKHRSVPRRASAALQLLLMAEFMGAEKVLSGGQTFTKSFLFAVSELCQDISSEVRPYGKAILQDLVQQGNFRKMWKECVSMKSRLEVESRFRDVFQITHC